MTWIIDRRPVALSSARPRSTAPRWPRGAGVLTLAVAGIAAWWPVLGSSLLLAAPVVGTTAYFVSGRGRLRGALLALVVWVPLALLLAGLPVSVLRPTDLAATFQALSDGWRGLGLVHGGATNDPWIAGAALVAFGWCWCIAGVVSTQVGRASAGLAFVLCAVPFAAASAFGESRDAAWHGAALLAAGLLWMNRGRAVPAIAATLAIAAVALLGAQAFGPQDRWLAFGGDRRPAFTELETQQTYGPLGDRRTGATMLEITAAQPALWRMQVLNWFDGRGFNVSRRIERPLPEPAARSITTTVKVKGLRNRLVVAAGSVGSVASSSSHQMVPGEAVQLTPGPKENQTYKVTSQVVDATADELAAVRIPSGSTYDHYTRFFAPPSSPIPRPAAAIADNLPPGYEGTPLAGVLTLARNLSRGTQSELEVVRRVERYLDDPQRFRYTTDVQPGGDQPLADFLLVTHAGYCQHFAGAAALLLRLAGIPTRVVSGFATGTPTGANTYEVRDEDAHAWIEVYFPGYGWVPFNPTPAVADAKVAASLDMFAPPPSRFASVQGAATPVALLVLAAGGFGGWFWLRRRRRAGGFVPAAQLGDRLARLVPGPIPPGTTLTRLQPQLAAIGPHVAGLAAQVERERFADADGSPPTIHRPRWQIWRALRADAGAVRATLLLATRR